MYKSSESAAKKILAASNALRRTLAQAREENPELTEISVRVGGKAEEPEKTSKAADSKLIISITAESQAHAEQHGAELEGQGCFCTSTGETSIECDCSGVQ